MIQKINNGITGAEASEIIYENDLLASGATFDLSSLGASVAPFTDIVKNVYILSRTRQINPDNTFLTYVGINTAGNGKLVVQFAIDGERVNFFMPTETPSAWLRNGIFKMIVAEGNYIAEVYVELKNVNFPTGNCLLGIEESARVLTPNAFPSPILEAQLKALTSVNFRHDISQRIAALTIKNVYMVSSIEGLKVEDLAITYVGMNFSGYVFLIQLSYQGDAANATSYKLMEVPEGGKIYKLPINDNNTEFARKTDVYIEFQPFAAYPSNSFQIFTNYEGAPRLMLTEEALNIPNQYNTFKPSDNGSVKVTEIRVSTANGRNAIQDAIDSITDASATNRYIIRVSAGRYEALNSSHYKGYRPDYPAFICPKDYVDIIGDNKADCIVYATLPENDAEIDRPVHRNMHQAVYNFANESTIENLTIIVTNIRYTIHQDETQEAFKTRYYKNVDLIYRGNRGSAKALGIGTFSGSETYLTGGSAMCESSGPFAIHNNQAFTKLSKWGFKNYRFSTPNTKDAILLQNSGSLINDELILEGCNFSGNRVVHFIDWWIYTHGLNDHFNHAEWRVLGSGNTPFYFKNTVEGYSLAVRSTGGGVRFVQGSSAYDVLIKNTKPNKFGQLGNPERRIFNQEYIYYDGHGLTLPSYAIGCVGVRETPFLYGTTISAEPMGKRLGDCSTVNKVLGISINNVVFNVTFNKNYTAFTNAQILAEINAVLGSAGEAYIANVGADYYPELTDVLSVEPNGTNDVILKGHLVKLTSSGIEKAQEGDKVYGLLIDDLKPYWLGANGIVNGIGRVIKNCYISVTPGNISSVRADTTATRYRVSNGELVADPTGELVADANGLILI